MFRSTLSFSSFVLPSILALASGAASAADIGQPSAGADQGFAGMSGFIDTSYAHTRARDYDLDGDTWTLRGSINAPISGGVNVQLDGSVGWVDQNGGEATNYSGTAHVYYRPQTDFAVGGFGHLARSDSTVFGGNGFEIESEAKDYLLGAEAGWFTQRAGFTIQGGFGKTDLEGFKANHMMAAMGINYLLTDNVRLDTNLGYHKLDLDDVNASLDIVSLQALMNYRLDRMPITLYGGYRRDRAAPEVAGIEFDSASADTFLLGLRGHFGTSSLKDEMDRGPIWSSPSLIP